MTSLPVGFQWEDEVGFKPSPYSDPIGGIESAGSGGYRAIGPTHPKYGRALGKHQVMEANLPEWSRTHLGREISADEFLNNPEAQERIFAGQFGSYADKYGPEGAARAWFAGEGGMNNPDRKDVLGTSVADYARKFNTGLGSQASTQMASASPLPSGFVWEDDQQQPQQMPQLGIEVEQPGTAQASMLPGEGMAKSFGSGLLHEGLAGMAGLPGDVRSLAARGIESATGMELPNMPSWMPNSIGGIPTGAKTTEQIQSGLKGSGVPDYQPQNVAEEYARTAGAFAPAVFGGTGSLARKTAQAFVPAATSETAGQVARQVAPEYEGAARVAGGVAGIVPTAKAGASRLPKRGIPESTDELKRSADSAYKLAEQSGLVIKGDSFRRLVAGLVPRIQREGVDRTIHPKVSAAIERLGQAADSGQPLTLQEFDTLRRVVGASAKSIEPDERRIATIVIDRLDDFFDNIKRADVDAGDWKTAVPAIKEARALWRRMRKSEQIDNIIEVAKDRAGQFSVSGNENALRTGFRQLSMKITRDKREAAKWTPEEKKLIRQLAGRMTGVNILRTLGKLTPKGTFAQLGLAGAAGGAYAASDPSYLIGAGAVSGLSGLSQLAAMGLTKRKAGQLQRRVRAGGNTPLIPGAPPALGAALMSGQASTLPWRDQ